MSVVKFRIAINGSCICISTHNLKGDKVMFFLCWIKFPGVVVFGVNVAGDACQPQKG